jgi:N-acetylmuramoyl-L-alanine amidase
MEPTDNAEFIAKSGAPIDPIWGTLEPVIKPLPRPAENAPLVVVIDPGHGGIDPGAGHGGFKESDLMLQLGIEVAEALNRAGGVRAILTRDSDVFVPLQSRITIARQNNADLLISLHADALSEGQARGASIYTLSEDGEDDATARMAERHERGDILAGLDLSGQDDRVANVLMDLARFETGPQGQRLASHLLDQLNASGAKLHRRPLRRGRLAVLNAADFASVLLEVGFLSNSKDREMLLDSEKRRPLVDGIVAGVLIWALAEDARAE